MDVPITNSMDMTQSMSKIDTYNRKLNEIMSKLIRLKKERSKLIKEIENQEVNGDNGLTTLYNDTRNDNTKIKKNKSRISSFSRKKEKLRIHLQKLRKDNQECNQDLRKAENKFKELLMEVRVEEKKRDDLLMYKKRSIKHKNTCKVDEEIVKKYRTESSNTLLKKIKKLSGIKFQYTEKDKIIYNQLHEFENKRNNYKDQIDTIKDNKYYVKNHLKKCDKIIEQLSKDYFDTFKDHFFSIFKKFEPNFVISASLESLTQNTNM